MKKATVKMVSGKNRNPDSHDLTRNYIYKYNLICTKAQIDIYRSIQIHRTPEVHGIYQTCKTRAPAKNT